jgi:3-oxoacyl-[acyl-carrier protein] reductase
MRLANKVAIITGAGSGIGRASAVLFSKEGAKIVVADINDDGGQETVNVIKSGGGVALAVHTDVTVSSEIENLGRITIEKFGKIDILFNNAGIPQQTMSFENVTEVLWDRIFATNVKSIFLTAKSIVPAMKAAGGGVIINLASISGIRPRPGNIAYATSKAAVILLTKALALEVAGFHIRVNCINPVGTDTPMLGKFFAEGVSLEEGKKATINTIPLGRLSMPEDVANAALFLASDESSMLTGTCIDVDGGRAI